MRSDAGWVVMEGDRWSYLIDLECIGQQSHSSCTYLVAYKSQRDECLHKVMEMMSNF